MEEFPVTSENGNYDKDSLSDDQFSNDSLCEKDHETEHEPIPIRRQGSYTIEMTPEMMQSIKEYKLRQPIYVKTDHTSQNSYASDMSSDIYLKTNHNQKNLMTQSMYERPWISSKKNNSIVSSINKQREQKLQLAKEEQNKRQLKRVVGLNESQKHKEIARKRKEEEMNLKNIERKRKAEERQRIVEERKQRLIQAEEARKSRILQKMINQEERHQLPHSSSNMMTMSCYGALGSGKRKPGNKEVVKERFNEKRPLSSTGKVIGFGSSSPRMICENPMKTIQRHPQKISSYLLERAEALSRPASSRISDRMINSVIISNPPVMLHPPIARQGSLRSKRQSTTMTSSVIDNSLKVKSTEKAKSAAIKEHSPDERTTKLTRSNSRKANSLKTTQNVTQSNRERPSSAKPHENHLTEGKITQSKSSTFPKTITFRQSNKVDLHLDSDSIEDEGMTLTESFTQPKSATISSVSMKKNEINKTDLSSADSLEAENLNVENQIIDNQSSTNEKSTSKSYPSGRALPTKDISETEYKARLMENRRLIREKREKEREQLMKAERERRHAEESALKEIMELEKLRANSKENYRESTNYNESERQVKENKTKEIARSNDEEKKSAVTIEVHSVAENVDNEKEIENKEIERLERKKRLESIMSRLKKTTEESSSEGGGISPRRAMSPELAEIDTEVTVSATNPTFRSSLLQSMLNKGKLSGISKNSTLTNKDEETRLPTDNVLIGNNSACGVLPLTSLRESLEDSESLINNVNSKSSVAVCSSELDGSSLSELLISDHGNVERQEEHKTNDGDPNISDTKAKNDYSSVSSIETEDDEIIQNSFKEDHLYNSHLIRPLAQEGCVFQS